MNTASVTLYYREGSSDKVYQASIEPSGGNFVVNFAYGRRGSTMQTGCKTFEPVSFEAAKKVYDKLVREKTSKGYTPGTDGTPYAHTNKEQRATGLLPQLLNPIYEPRARELLNLERVWAQEKMDGRRIMLCRQSGQVSGSNRLGLSIALPHPVEQALKKFNVDCILDGESIGDTVHAFDLLSMNGVDLRSGSFQERHRQLCNLLKANPAKSIHLVEVTKDAPAKHRLFERLQREQREGIVFKHCDSVYVSGRPASGGSQLKFKFYATATCLVVKANAGKRSIALELVGDAGQGIGVGNVTIPPSVKVPRSGTMVEVRYLYAFPKGSLYQPTYLGVRDDLSPQACSLSQLKYKPCEDDDA